VLPCLAALSRRHRLAIISNGDGVAQRLKLARTGLSTCFDPIVLSGECGLAKPDARLFLHACDLGGHVPGAALCVGDRYDLDARAPGRLAYGGYGSTATAGRAHRTSRP
jgi:putative hydrolase of the HAD superfamily